MLLLCNSQTQHDSGPPTLMFRENMNDIQGRLGRRWCSNDHHLHVHNLVASLETLKTCGTHTHSPFGLHDFSVKRTSNLMIWREDQTLREDERWCSSGWGEEGEKKRKMIFKNDHVQLLDDEVCIMSCDQDDDDHHRRLPLISPNLERREFFQLTSTCDLPLRAPLITSHKKKSLAECWLICRRGSLDPWIESIRDTRNFRETKHWSGFLQNETTRWSRLLSDRLLCKRQRRWYLREMFYDLSIHVRESEREDHSSIQIIM